MIRKLTNTDFPDILSIVDDAAMAYKGKISADCWKEPYMSAEELKEEIRSGVQFYGILKNGKVIAVMGIQPIGNVTLIRHAYTQTNQQRKGMGQRLLKHLLFLAKTQRILVGTWETASWAIKFYQKHGFKLLSRKETNNLLKKYWRISQRQVETSIVLEYKGQPI